MKSFQMGKVIAYFSVGRKSLVERGRMMVQEKRDRVARVMSLSK